MIRLGVWVPFRAAGPLGAPEELPLGRAALQVLDEGVELVLGQPDPGGRFTGVRARPGHWEAVQGVEIAGVYDRFPSASRPERFEAGLRALQVPVGNAPATTSLCRDKLACQDLLEAHGVAMPPVEGDPARFEERLTAWGDAFAKPREGSFGEGVRRLRAGDPVPSEGILQRAVLPPGRFGAGLALRVLVQRDVDGGFVVRPAVARLSDDDPVVNAARGARVLPAQDLELDLDRIGALAIEAVRPLLRAEPFLEAGVDIVLDRDDTPFVIELNSRPRGRLRALAALDPSRFHEAHVQACVAPFRRLAALVEG